MKKYFFRSIVIAFMIIGFLTDIPCFLADKVYAETSSANTASSKRNYFTSPGNKVIKELESAYTRDGICYVLYDSKNGYRILSNPSVIDVCDTETINMIKELLSEEKYNSYLKEGILKDDETGKDMTYKEYKKYICEMIGVSEQEISSPPVYDIYFEISGFFSNNKEIKGSDASAAFRYVVSILQNDGTDAQKVVNAAKNRNTQTEVTINIKAQGNTLIVTAKAYTYNKKTGREDTIIITDGDAIEKDGKQARGVKIGNDFIPSDTSSLYISSNDDTISKSLDGFSIEDTYDKVIYNVNGEIDIKELAQNMSGLKKLYISKWTKAKNLKYLTSIKGLEELHISLADEKNVSYLNKLAIKKLYLYNVEIPLGKLTAKEIIIECVPKRKVLASIFELPMVTELEITDSYSVYRDRSAAEITVDLTGIEKLVNLKKLDLSFNSSLTTVDMSPLAGLKRLREIFIDCRKPINLDSVTKISSLRVLKLYSMENADLSFLAKMTRLETLWLGYVGSSYKGSIGKLQNLKVLYITDVTGTPDYSEIYSITSLEDITIFGEKVDTHGINKLKKLKSLNLMLCSYSSLPDVKKLDKLETLAIYNCVTPKFNANDVKGMKKLKTLWLSSAEIYNYESLKTLTGLKKMALDFCDLTEEQVKDLQKSLPKCEIEIYKK